MKLAAKLAIGALVAGAATLLPVSPARADPGTCSAGPVTPSLIQSWAICKSGSGHYQALVKCSNGLWTAGNVKAVGGGYSYASCTGGTKRVNQAVVTSP